MNTVSKGLFKILYYNYFMCILDMEKWTETISNHWQIHACKDGCDCKGYLESIHKCSNVLDILN